LGKGPPRPWPPGGGVGAVRGGGPPPPRPPGGGVVEVLGGGPPRPRPLGGGVRGGPGNRAASPAAAGRRGGEGPGGGAASPPAAGWWGGGGAGGESRFPLGRRVAGGGAPGGLAAPPPAYKAAPQASILRTENELFSLWKSSRFYRPGGTFSPSSALCIFGMAALRTNLSSANGGRGRHGQTLAGYERASGSQMWVGGGDRGHVSCHVAAVTHIWNPFVAIWVIRPTPITGR